MKADQISTFRYPDLPRIIEPPFKGGWETALERNISFIVNRINERVLAGQSIEVLLAVLMFVLMGITLERSKIANDLLTTMARVFGPLPGGLAVSVVVWWFLDVYGVLLCFMEVFGGLWRSMHVYGGLRMSMHF